MDHAPLVKDDILAGSELVRKYGEIQPLRAAFWLRSSDDDQASLYLAVDGLDGTDQGPAYLQMSEVAEAVLDPGSRFLYLRVKLIGEKNAIAQAAIDLNQTFPDPHGHSLHNTMFGNVFAEEVFVYPTWIPAAVG